MIMMIIIAFTFDSTAIHCVFVCYIHYIIFMVFLITIWVRFGSELKGFVIYVIAKSPKFLTSSNLVK